MNKEMVYKKMEDHIYFEFVPEEWTGYDNPSILITVKRPFDEYKQLVLKREIESALLRFGALTGHKFKAEIKL